MNRNTLAHTGFFALVAARMAIAFPVGFAPQTRAGAQFFKLQFALLNATKERQCQ